jgi:hypothetical protein
MAARPKSYIRKQAAAKFKRRWKWPVFRVSAAAYTRRGPIMASKRLWACASILVRSDLILAEMSHRIGFRLKAVARNAHAALRCNITISQNRGNASAREPRTYHGRGFSLLHARVSPAPSWSFSSMARR